MGSFYAIDGPTDVCTSWKNASGNNIYSNLALDTSREKIDVFS